MAHPILEALYLGLLASGLSQPAAQPEVVMSVPKPPASVQMPMRQRVVYDWAAGERHVFRHRAADPAIGEQPLVGMSDAQVKRVVVRSNG